MLGMLPSASLGHWVERAQLAYRYVQGLAGLKSDDVILTSFPKSGNTWVRFFLCNLISLRAWDGEPVTFPRLNATMPELGVSNLLRPWPYEGVLPRIVKTHKPRWPVFKNLRAALLIRDPRDVMVSYYHFERKRVGGRFDGDFATFLRHPDLGLKAWFRHYASWHATCDVCIRYEDLKADDVETFTALLNGLALTFPAPLVEEAAKRSRFERMRKTEADHGISTDKEQFKGGGRFMRSGKTGGWDDYFNEQDRAYYAQLCQRHGLDMYA